MTEVPKVNVREEERAARKQWVGSVLTRKMFGVLSGFFSNSTGEEWMQDGQNDDEYLQPPDQEEEILDNFITEEEFTIGDLTGAVDDRLTLFSFGRPSDGRRHSRKIIRGRLKQLYPDLEEGSLDER